MIFNYVDFRGNKGSINVIDTNQKDILKALPEKYHKNSVVKISREKNKIYITPISTHSDGRDSITELMYLK